MRGLRRDLCVLMQAIIAFWYKFICELVTSSQTNGLINLHHTRKQWGKHMKTEIEMAAEIGKQVRRYREMNGFTQEKLAELVDVSSTTISRLENGDQMVGVFRLMRIADALGTTADALLYPSDPEQTESDEWKERMIALIEKYTDRQKKYIWKVMKAFSELESEADHDSNG